MNNKTTKWKLATLMVVAALSFFSAVPALAYYALGETMNPSCAPGASGCDISPTTAVSAGGTGLASFTAGDLLYASATTTLAKLAIGINGKVLKVSGGTLSWGDDAGGTSYTAGTGLSLTGSTFAINLASTNTWSGLQTFDGGISVNGNTYTNLAGTGLSFLSGVLSSALGTSVESSEITDGTIAAGDIANGTLTLAKLGQNSCATNEIIKWNGSAWACSTDSNNTYTAGTGLSLTGGAFAMDINGLSAVSSAAGTDTVAIYTGSGLKKITRSDLFSDVLGSLNYRGTWNANTNSPALVSGTGTKGYYYVVSTAGSTNLDGISSWAVNDWAVFNGTAWEKVQTTNAVTSVFGRTGAVVASGGDYTAAQITNTPSGNIAAVTAQNALNELDSEKLATGLNSGLLWVGNVSNQAAAVSVSGDATIDNAGALTIGANAIALGTDTTGNYVATVADSGSSIISVANSGTENAAVTLGIVDDSLNFTKLADGLTLDAGTSITLGGNDLTFAITGGGLPKFTRTSAGQWMNFADGTDVFGIYNRAGTPESFIAADKGSLAIDTSNGALYIKTTDTLNTGWSQFGSTNALVSLNGLTATTQTFAVGTSGIDFAITSSGSAHTFNIPDASATARGLVTTGAQTIAGAKTFSSTITAPTSTNSINGLIINSGALTGITGLTMTSGNADMASGLVLNIGAAGTDFTAGGGLNLAGDFAIATNKFTVASSTGNTAVAGTFDSTGLVTGAAGFKATTGGLELASNVPGVTTNKLYNSGSTLYWNGTQVIGGSVFSGLTNATGANTVDNTNYAQTWNWSTQTTGNALAISANALTTGTGLALTSSYASGNSTNGLLYVANTGAVTNGVIARIAANSTAGSGLTVLANGNVGIGVAAPNATLEVRPGAVDSGIVVTESDSNTTAVELEANATRGYVGLHNSTGGRVILLNADAGVNSWINNGGFFGLGTSAPTAALTFAASSTINSLGALTVNSASTNALTLDSGTTGAINIGTNANAKTITIGNTTAGTVLAINAGNTSSGNINFDSGTLMVDSVSNKVGIGTGSGTAKLDVYHSGAVTTSNEAGARINNSVTSGVASLNKYGLFLSSAGTFNGSGAVNYGLYAEASGGTTNWAGYFANDVKIAGNLYPSGSIRTEAGHELQVYTSSGNYMRFFPSGVEVLRIGGTSSEGMYYYNNTNSTTGNYLCLNNTSNKVTYGASCSLSLLKYKKNIEDLNGGLSTVMKLRPVTFDWNPETYKGSVGEMARRQVGMIAEEVEGVDPLFAVYDFAESAEGRLSSVEYIKLGVLAIKAIQEQQGLITNLASSTASMQADIETLKSQITAGLSGFGSVTISSLNQLAISGALSVDGHVALGKDTVGEAMVLANTTMVTIPFNEAYAEKPVITVTPNGAYSGLAYGVQNITPIGFDIVISPAQSTDILFAWHAFAQKGKAFEVPAEVPAQQSASESVINPEPIAETPPASTDTPVPETPTDTPTIETTPEETAEQPVAEASQEPAETAPSAEQTPEPTPATPESTPAPEPVSEPSSSTEPAPQTVE